MAITPYKQLEQEWKRLHAFSGALSLLRWDAAVMMPRGSSDVRGEQLAAHRNRTARAAHLAEDQPLARACEGGRRRTRRMGASRTCAR
jgi:Zn-dependent M32 family carboxypeptidase